MESSTTKHCFYAIHELGYQTGHYKFFKSSIVIFLAISLSFPGYVPGLAPLGYGSLPMLAGRILTAWGNSD